MPSDLLSYNGFSVDVAIQDKIANVRDNVKSVMNVVEAERKRQLEAEQAKTEMALEKTIQNAANETIDYVHYCDEDLLSAVSSGPLPVRASRSRAMVDWSKKMKPKPSEAYDDDVGSLGEPYSAVSSGPLPAHPEGCEQKIEIHA